MNTKTEALSTRIRFRLKTQLFLSVFKNNPRSPPEQENGVFQKFHFVDLFRKVPLLFHRSRVDERPIREKKVAGFQKNPDTCIQTHFVESKRPLPDVITPRDCHSDPRRHSH